MNLRVKAFSLSLCLILTAQGERESLVSEDIYLRINECINEYHHTSAKWSESKTKELREKAFAGLDDREKILALAEWMFRKPPPHYYGIASQAKELLLIAPEPVIKDYSELRRLMMVETDSKRFYQLSMLSYSAEKDGHDFMVDRARGLFMEGVAADRGQSSTGHPLDSISGNFFSRITEELRDKSQTFKDEVYPEMVKLDLKERNLALAKWLKANWPGCENLEIPEKKHKLSKSSAREPLEPRLRPEKRLKVTNKVEEAVSSFRLYPWQWIIAMLMMLGMFIGFIRIFRVRKGI